MTGLSRHPCRVTHAASPMPRHPCRVTHAASPMPRHPCRTAMLSPRHPRIATPDYCECKFASCKIVYRQYKCADDLRLRATCKVGKRVRRPRTRPTSKIRASARLQRAEYLLGSLAQRPQSITAFPVAQIATWVVTQKHSRQSERCNCLCTLLGDGITGT
jgi:hypothetical protein